ncbi:MAG TPA: DUF1592 domain-containing protein, partial [Polyangiales bacterium]|nr:DUF1592 domain-containing protein [Polyangiales bacterium]
PTQYDNTVRDLLGVEGTWGTGFPADTVVSGFRNNADAMLVSPLLADKLREAAEDIGQRVPLSRLAACAGSGSGDDACLTEIARTLGERAFRKPLRDEDVERYLALAKTAAAFEAGARLMVSALLQSPHFVYRFELGARDAADPRGRYALGDYEIASELSYLLWQSMPDETLFAAARAGQLRTLEQIRAQVGRMLADARSKPTVRAFVLEWLGLAAIATVPKDPGRFPELDAELRGALLGEVERFVDHVMFELDGSAAALLTTPATFLDQALADFYGVPLSGAAADGIARVELGAQQRRGILTLGGTMLAHARSNDSSPVHRGKLIRERLLCQPLLPPPPGIVVQPPPLDPSKTTRDRYAAHSQIEPCKTCHRLMDPIGLGFEHFDGIGRYRADDNGLAIDASGEIFDSPSSNGAFDGSGQLIDKLAASEDVRSCYARQWLRFAYGTSEDGAGKCVSEQIQKAYANSDGSLAALLAILTEGDQLRYRSAPVESGPPPPVVEDPPSGDGGMPGSVEPDPESMLSSALQLKQTVDNDWGAGYCATYEVTNVSSAAVTWSVPLEISGTLSQNWQSKVTGSAGAVVFTGETYNATLEPNASTQFGFCANRG